MLTSRYQMTNSTFSQWLLSELESREWSQVDLSRKSGVSQAQITRVLSGERGIGEKALSAIASALKLPPEPERAKAIIFFLIDTGVRAEELCNIKVGHVDKRLMRVKVFGKGAKDRYVSFSSRTAQALWRYLSTRDNLQDHQYLFASRGSSGQLTRSRLLKMLIAIGNRAGVKGVNIHRFRHLFAIQYLRNRGDAYTLQRLLGHSTLDMVKRYLALVQSDVDDAYKRASPVDNWNL